MRTLGLLAALSLVAACGDPGEMDGEHDSFAAGADPKGDTFGIEDQSPVARGVLRVANELTPDELREEVGLREVQVDGIMRHRDGPDALRGTEDDRELGSLVELDAVPWIGGLAFHRMLEAAEARGYVGPPRWIGPPERRARLELPDAHDGHTPLPLVLLLHPYKASAGFIDLYFRATSTARRQGLYLVIPNGTREEGSLLHHRFWNAMPSCCDSRGSGVDDVAYLRGLLDEAEAVVPVDRSQVYIVGHSNGGFMAYRLACELSERVTAIASLAGSDFPGDLDCVPARAVPVLQIHGDADDTVTFDGDDRHPSAPEVVRRWARRAHCDPDASERLADRNLVWSVRGDETTVERWSRGCEAGVDVELWRVRGAGHVPLLASSFFAQVNDWLLLHRR